MKSGTSAVKALQQWCRVQCEGYRDVNICNMTTSFRDGMAFCALIHRHRPELIDFDSLKKENVYENNKLAFAVAQEQLGIPALLDAEDMVALKVPDRLSILTYVSQYYNYFHGRSPIGGLGGVKRPSEGPADEPPGRKNQPVTAKVFPPQDAPAAPAASQTGTLSSKCASCNKHVHLVQRHLLDGKLYHRNCAKSLSPSNPSAAFRDFPRSPDVHRVERQPGPRTPTPIATPTPTPTRTPASVPTPTPNTTSTSTPTATRTVTSAPTPNTTPLWLAGKSAATSASPSRFTSVLTVPAKEVTVSRPAIWQAGGSPAAAPKPPQSKLRLSRADNDDDSKGATRKLDADKKRDVAVKTQESSVSAAVRTQVTVVSASGGDGKQAGATRVTAADRKALPEKEDTGKTEAAAFISRKLAEEKGVRTAPARKTDPSDPPRPAAVQTPVKDAGGGGGRVKLRPPPSLLTDLVTPTGANTPRPAHNAGAGTPDKGGARTPGAPVDGTASESGSPADWRSRLRPVSKDPKPAAAAAATRSFPASRNNDPANAQTPDPPARPSPAAAAAHPPILRNAVSPPPSKGTANGPKETVATETGPEPKICKAKPDFIPKGEIMRELQEIEDNLNELERRGVELENRLRCSEEEGEDELMVEWFNLIRNKQVAIRRESELVYIGRTQDLEEQQPSVEQELRRLMEKPEHLKLPWERKREEELMAKLVEIVNDRNAIVDGLDEDRLREEEEDEQLNKMMMNFNFKKEKPKKKSPVFKLFGWGNKKEA